MRFTLNNAIIRLLRPLVLILLRHGVSHAEFSDLAKLVYVDTAEHDFEIEGRKKSIARICVLTGMHRKDVNHVRERLKEDNFEVEQLSRAARVITGWLRDEEFRASGEVIRVLPLEGDFSFSSLVKRYSGDMPVRAVLDELEQSGTVKRKDKTTVELINKAYIPHESDERMLHILGISTADMLSTMDFNINKRADEDSRLQLVVDYEDIPESRANEFKAYSDKKIFEMLQNFDAWLAQNNDNSANETTKRIGFGMYYFEGDIQDIKGSNHDK